MGVVRYLKDGLGHFMIGEQEINGTITTQKILSEDDVKRLISDSNELRRMKSLKWKLAGRRRGKH